MTKQKVTFDELEAAYEQGEHLHAVTDKGSVWVIGTVDAMEVYSRVRQLRISVDRYFDMPIWDIKTLPSYMKGTLAND